MTTHRYAPEGLDQIEWDVVVVGTGMGGATAGYELARLGRRVLFIEKGLFLQGQSASAGGRQQSDGSLAVNLDPTDESPETRLKLGRWPLRIQGRTNFREMEFFGHRGCGTGGTTLLYAAALERFFPADFQPRANFPDAVDSTLPERWPISYDDLRPFYEQAEVLFRVKGTPDPLGRSEETRLRTPPPLSPRDQHFLDSFGRLGLHPYRIHVGYEFVDGCTGCPAGPCFRKCKNDAGNICLVPALEKHGASLLPECEVVKIEAGVSDVKGIQCRWKGQTISIKAKTVVLAAGAYMTPVLLLNSKSEAWPEGLANRSGLSGAI